MKNLYLLDFDGTLSYKDSSKYFFKKLLGMKFYYLYYLNNIFSIIMYLLNFKSQFDLKKKRYLTLLNHSNHKKLSAIILKSDLLIEKILRPEALVFLKKIQNKDNKIIIVSAGLSVFLKRWAEKNSFDLLTNTLIINNQGEFDFVYSYDCNGIGKVKRINDYIDVKQFERIFAYGDSSGDFEMLKMADEAYFKPFN